MRAPEAAQAARRGGRPPSRRPRSAAYAARLASVSAIIAMQPTSDAANERAIARSPSTHPQYSAPSALLQVNMHHVHSAMSRAPLSLRATAASWGR